MLNHFFKNTISELPKIPRLQFWFGLIAGLFFAFSFYAVLYLSRESFRILSVNEYFDLLILTDNEVNFYNLFYAFVSVIFAQSISFIFWFNQPANLFSKRKYQQKIIVYDQAVLNSFFISWFLKIALVYGIFFGWSLTSEYHTFSFYPTYKYVFIFIIIVLYLQTWVSIRRYYKKQSAKLMAISFIFITVISFGLSKINLINYNEINKIVLSKNLSKKYQLNVPISTFYDIKFENQSLVRKVFVFANPNNINAQPLIYYNNQQVNLTDLKQAIEASYSNYNEEYVFIRHFLHIDKSIKMKYVNELKTALSDVGAYRIAYAVVPQHRVYNMDYYKNHHFSTIIPQFFSSKNKSINKTYRSMTDDKNIIEISFVETNNYLINNAPCLLNDLKLNIQNTIKNKPNYILQFKLDENMIFSDYMNMLTNARSAIETLRQEYSLRNYSKELYDLNENEFENVMQQYQFRIFEITSETKKQLEIK